MSEAAVICVDIGSTWTKGAIFRRDEDRFSLVKRASVTTTTDHLPDAFYAVLEQLSTSHGEDGRAPLYFSSSAKGGLRVAVVGLVPEMSLHIARLAAFSAGARVVASFPYRLGRASIAEIESSQPDILLLCGGTDGGNERYVTENAQVIAASNFGGTIVYAGNNLATDAVADALANRKLVVCENLMPEYGKLNTEPVRNAIRTVFLDSIVTGKGLSEIVARFGVSPVPTPLAVFNLVQAMGEHLEDWQNFALIDLGGATTDFYSFSEAWFPESDAIIKGIVEPKVKRTVEGDLGMRISAESTFISGGDYLRTALGDEGVLSLQDYVHRLLQNPAHLPTDPKEIEFDRQLAGACIHHALLRHAGTVEEVFTTKGPVLVQAGKDLRRIDKIVGTGGYLAACARNQQSVSIGDQMPEAAEKVPLVPQSFSYFADHDYLLPFIGCLAKDFPKQAALTAVDYLVQSGDQVQIPSPTLCKGGHFL